MDIEVRERLTNDLETRRDATVREWFELIARACYVPLTARAFQERLGDLLDRFIVLWLNESAEEEARRRAEEIGVDLAAFHVVNAEALGHTLRVLGTALPPSLHAPAPDVAELHARQAALLHSLAVGYYRQGCSMVLDEQEQVRSALVTSLQSAEAALRTARDELEVRVERRTAELAQANRELRSEVAERRRVEQELRESKERWRSLVENAPDLIGTVDRSGRIQFLSRLPAGSSIGVDSVIGAEGALYAEESYQEGVRSAIRQVFETGVSITRETAFKTLRGTTSWYAISYGPIWQDGEVSEVLFISRNIDQRKQLEEVKDNLIHDVSHELRTPLAKIRMSLELLREMAAKDDPDMDRIGRISHLAGANVDSLIETLEGILDLSRLQAGTWSYEAEPVRLGDVIDQVAADMGPLAQDKGLRIVTRVPPNLPPVTGDRDKLKRVLANLVDNAVKFSDRGTITLAATNDGGSVRVAVADQGQGILPENLARVFDRFFQEKTNSRGVGIGLSICQGIVAGHGGQIWAESQGRGYGTTFHLVFPAAPEELET